MSELETQVEPALKTLVCPHCGSESLQTEDVVLASTPCSVLRLPSGDLEYYNNGDTTVHDESSDSRGFLTCRECGRSVFEQDLVDKDGDPDEEPLADLDTALTAAELVNKVRPDVLHLLQTYRSKGGNPMDKRSLNRWGPGVAELAIDWLARDLGDLTAARDLQRLLDEFQAGKGS